MEKSVSVKESAKMNAPLLLRAFRKEKVERTPVWFMRQAGRYLPEYQAIRQKHSMLDTIRNPDLASEVTLQPIRRFEPDAAIIFADILNPLIGMGMELDFVKGSGPVFQEPIRSPEAVKKLIVPPSEENVGYTLEAIRLVVRELSGKSIPLIGFCGAPFTLSSYMIEGQGSNKLYETKRFMLEEPKAFCLLQEKLVNLLVDYLVQQVEAGAELLQVFDSWLGFVSPDQFERFVEPFLLELRTRVREQVSTPVVFFSTGALGLFPRIAKLGFDAIGVDWRTPLGVANDLLGAQFALQGNLDPCVLTGPKEYLLSEVDRILKEGEGLPGHVFNLGHGILPHTPIENVALAIERVKNQRCCPVNDDCSKGLSNKSQTV